MALKKRGRIWHLRIRPFGGRQVWVSTGTHLKSEAQDVERQILTACRSQDYRLLDPTARKVTLQMFRNQGWQVPADLAGEVPVADEITLWKGIELCLKYPDVLHSPNIGRHEQAFVRVVEKWGKEVPVRSIWIPEIKQYQIDRLSEGAAASTINKERAALSKMFQVLMELGLLDRNPIRLVRGPDEREGRREVYVSFQDFNSLVGYLPRWVQPIVRTLYFTGMRRGEVLGLTWENVNLESRIIRLHAHQTKERKPKRIPIHRVLVPTLEAVGKIRWLSTDRLFLTERGKPPSPDSLRKPWRVSVEAVGLDPAPTIHDLRHVWKTNAMRSGMDYEIREAILGHSRGIAERYGRISDQDLVRAINGMRFDEGETDIWIAKGRKGNPARGVAGSNRKNECKM